MKEPKSAKKTMTQDPLLYFMSHLTSNKHKKIEKNEKIRIQPLTSYIITIDGVD
jgi:hypothetical protein